jgi:Lon protease-like protein
LKQVWQIAHQTLEDGRSNLLLLGLRRVGLREELTADQPYRQAKVEVHLDRYAVAGAERRPALRKRLVSVLERILKRAPQAREHLERLLDSQIPLGVLTDVLASTIQLPCDFKQQMLAELDVDRRAELLLRRLGANLAEPPGAATRQRKFPPDVSLN